jgi:predicted transcriptional regulator
MKFIREFENISCKDVLQCVFELNKLDFNIYKILKIVGETRADALAKKMKKERSTVYRSLQKLTSCGLCKKKTKTIGSGGYYHIYSSNDPKKVKKDMESCIDRWYKEMKKTLKDFEEELG